MKKGRKVQVGKAWVLSVAFAFLLLMPVSKVDAKSIIGNTILKAKKETVSKGCKVKLSANVIVPLNNSNKIKWKSSDKKIATVNKKGVVKGKKTRKSHNCC